MIVIRRQVLLAVVLLSLTACLLAVGWANTPFENDRALLLTRDVQAIQTYLAQARRWRDVISAQNAALHVIFAADLEVEKKTPSSGQSGTPTPPPTPLPASGHPMHLYARSEQARQAWDALVAVQREMEATEVPPSLVLTHEQAQQALGAALGLGERTLEYVGAPTAERLDQLVAQWRLAEQTWKAFDRALGGGYAGEHPGDADSS